MIVLQKEFVEGKVSDFPFEFWRIIPTNGRYYFEKQNKTKQNKTMGDITKIME